LLRKKFDHKGIIFLILFFILVLIFYFRIFIIELNFLNLKNLRKLEIECGIFNIINKNSNSLIYSLFLILFLIFDLEISLIIIQILKLINVIIILILIFILLSLLLELFEMSIKWNDYAKNFNFVN